MQIVEDKLKFSLFRFANDYPVYENCLHLFSLRRSSGRSLSASETTLGSYGGCFRRSSIVLFWVWSGSWDAVTPFAIGLECFVNNNPSTAMSKNCVGKAAKVAPFHREPCRPAFCRCGPAFCNALK